MAFCATLLPSAGSHFSYRAVQSVPSPDDGQEDLQTTGQSSEFLVLGVTVGVARGLAVLLEVFLVQVVKPVAPVR